MTKFWVQFKETVFDDTVYYAGQYAQLTAEEIGKMRFSWFEFVEEPEEWRVAKVNEHAKRKFFSGRY